MGSSCYVVSTQRCSIEDVSRLEKLYINHVVEIALLGSNDLEANDAASITSGTDLEQIS